MYQIADKHDHSVVDEGFAKRELAKRKRNKLNEDSGHLDTNNPRYIISRGKDHPDGPSNGISAQQRGKNSYF